MVVKMTEGVGGYTPGSLITDKLITITPLQWDIFMLPITSSNCLDCRYRRGNIISEYLKSRQGFVDNNQAFFS